MIKAWATEGHSVALPGLGTMRFGLRAKSVENVEDVKSSLISSRRIFYNLVLHYSLVGEDADNPGYYLHDCYPALFINDERTQANIKKNAIQWETFTKYLESKGKLKK